MTKVSANDRGREVGHFFAVEQHGRRFMIPARGVAYTNESIAGVDAHIEFAGGDRLTVDPPTARRLRAWIVEYYEKWAAPQQVLDIEAWVQRASKEYAAAVGDPHTHVINSATRPSAPRPECGDWVSPGEALPLPDPTELEVSVVVLALYDGDISMAWHTYADGDWHDDAGYPIEEPDAWTPLPSAPGGKK